MHARVNTFYGDQDKIEDGIAHLEGSDRAVVEATAGNLGLTTLVDREAAVIVAVSYWDEPALSWNATLTRAREDAAAAAGGNLVVESYEVTAQDRMSVPLPGATVRAGRMQIDAAKLTDGQAFVRDEVLPRLRVGSGFCGAEFLVDSDAGTGLLLTVWAGEDAATWGDSVLDQLQEEAVERVGAKLPRAETYALVRGWASA
ncbi:MAG: hypothetical protein L0H84_07675 [Pseudonocardia sp.]|nr:hypothetical protein [Pseudonocardia sp.]